MVPWPVCCDSFVDLALGGRALLVAEGRAADGVIDTDGGSARDVTLPPLDASAPDLAGFAFIVNDVLQHP